MHRNAAKDVSLLSEVKV